MARKSRKFAVVRPLIKGKRKSRRKLLTQAFISGPAIIPDRYMCKLKYSESGELSAAALKTWVMRGNSINDPSYTTAGHQPAGHDQLGALYNRYRVVASSMEVLVTPKTSTAGSVLKYLISPRAELPSPTAWSIEVEQPYVKRMGYTSHISGGGSLGKPLKMYMPSNKVFGVSKTKAEDDDYSAAIGSNPSREWYWHFTTAAADETTSVECQVDILMTYFVIFYDRKELAQS